jgi:hypothetical protein
MSPASGMVSQVTGQLFNPELTFLFLDLLPPVPCRGSPDRPLESLNLWLESLFLDGGLVRLRLYLTHLQNRTAPDAVMFRPLSEFSVLLPPTRVRRSS